jgi:hypothetical protein
MNAPFYHSLLDFRRVAGVVQSQWVNSSTPARVPQIHPNPIPSRPAGGVGISGGVPGSPGVATADLVWDLP